MSTSVVQTVVRTTQRGQQGNPEILLALPTPSGAVWNEGIEQQVYKRRNSIGDLITDELMVKAREPIITVQYPRATKELYSFKLGFELDTGASTGEQFAQSFRVGADLTVDPKATGIFGEGALADTGEASYLLNGKSTALARTAGTPPAASGEYQVLANGAFLFHPDQANSLVTVTAPIDVAALDSIGERPFDIHELWLYFIIQVGGIREVASLHFNRAQVNRQESSEFDFDADTFDLVLNSLDDNCVPDLKFYNQQAVC